MLDWGAVPDWVEAVGTVGALIAAVILLRHEQLARHSAQISRLFVERIPAETMTESQVYRDAKCASIPDSMTSGRSGGRSRLPSGGLSLYAYSEDGFEGDGEDYEQRTLNIYVENASDGPVNEFMIYYYVRRVSGDRYWVSEPIIAAPEAAYINWEYRRRGFRRHHELRMGVSVGGYLRPRERRWVARVVGIGFGWDSSVFVTDGEGRGWAKRPDGSWRRERRLSRSAHFGWQILAGYPVEPSAGSGPGPEAEGSGRPDAAP